MPSLIRHALRVFIVLIISSSSLAVSLAQQDDARLRSYIMAVDDSHYPTIHLYLNVVDAVAGVPIDGLQAGDFLVTANHQQRLDSFEVKAGNRPVHLMVVLDLTSSVSAQEFEHMQTAAALLIASLDVQDQVGVVTMDDAEATLLQPLSPDHNAALNAMYSGDVEPVPNRGSNVVANGIYHAVEALTTTSPDVRSSVVVFTDVPSGNIGGEYSLDDVRGLAAERGTSISTIYFATESSNNSPPPTAPAELIALASDTGGLVVERLASIEDEDVSEWGDDELLPEMAQQVADILAQEYQLSFAMPFTADDQRHALSIVASTRGLISSSASIDFQARAGLVNLDFANLENGQRVDLPLDVQIETLSSSNPLTRLILYRVDHSSGEAIEIETQTSVNSVFRLVPQDFASGVLTLKVVGQDANGNQGEKYLTLIVENGALIPSVSNSTLTPNDNHSVPQTEDKNASPLLYGAGLLVAIGIIGAIGGLIYWRRKQKQRPLPAPVVAQAVPLSPLPTLATTPPPLPSYEPVVIASPTVTPSQVVALEEETQITEVASVVEAQSEGVRGYLIGKNGEKYALYEGENTIGRHGSNMIQIPDATTSRHHAVIEIYGAMVEYQDWQASHVSVINGRPLKAGERYSLQANDEIQLGTSKLRFILPSN